MKYIALILAVTLCTACSAKVQYKAEIEIQNPNLEMAKG